MNDEYETRKLDDDRRLERIAALERDYWRAETANEARSIERAIQKLTELGAE